MINKYVRSQTKLIVERIKEPKNLMQIILGPRQVGKTTGILQALELSNLPNLYSAADEGIFYTTEWITAKWTEARAKCINNTPFILVLDEIQKIENWSETVKKLWDEDVRQNKNLYVVILGSASLLLQKGMTESLAGRFEIIRYPHWTWLECKEAFNLTFEEYIYFGGYPKALEFKNDENRFKNYVQNSLLDTVLNKDILQLNKISNPALLKQLFILSCEYCGQILSYRKMLGQLQDKGNSTIIADYQLVLESAYMIKGLQKWSERPITTKSSSPKWIPLNTAMISSLSSKTFQQVLSDREYWGRLIESAVGAHIINSFCNGEDLFYWREGVTEIDFVIKNKEKLLGIEVKSGRRTTQAGIKQFNKQFPEIKVLIVGQEGMNIQTFFETPIDKLF